MYKLTFLALILSTYSYGYSIDDYKAEYRFKSSEVNLKGIRQLRIDEKGESSLTFKGKSTLARLYFKTVFTNVTLKWFLFCMDTSLMCF